MTKAKFLVLVNILHTSQQADSDSFPSTIFVPKLEPSIVHFRLHFWSFMSFVSHYRGHMKVPPKPE